MPMDVRSCTRRRRRGGNGTNGPLVLYQGGGSSAEAATEENCADGPPVLHLHLGGGSAVAAVEEEDTGNFAGASGASSRRPDLHFCDFCKTGYPLASIMAHVSRLPPHDFMVIIDDVVQEACVGKFEVKFKTNVSWYCCIYCKGKFDMKSYLKEHPEIKGKMIPTPEWVRACRKAR